MTVMCKEWLTAGLILLIHQGIELD